MKGKGQSWQKVIITAGGEPRKAAEHREWLYLLLGELIASALKVPDVKCLPLEETLGDSSALVIGFELPKEAGQQLDARKQPYLSLAIHPLRYMDDIFFAFRTNSDAMLRTLQAHEVNPVLCQAYANMVQATVLKSKKKPLLPPDTLLLVGQTERDLVIFDGESYLSLLDFIDAIAPLAATHRHVVFKPHPYARNNRMMHRQLKKRLGKVAMTYANIYHLLSQPTLSHVCALNSSVLYEAEMFMKTATFLYKPPFNGEALGIYDAWLSGSFWSTLLSPHMATTPSDIVLPFRPDRLRIALNDFWSYGEVSGKIVMMDLVKSALRRYLR